MICKKMTTASSRITKIGGGLFHLLKHLHDVKTEPYSYLCKIDIWWVVLFFNKIGTVCTNCQVCEYLLCKYRLIVTFVNI
jgi:hypothetical protein